MPSKDQIDRYAGVAKNVLAMCKKSQPDFWTPSEDLVKSWGYAFACKPFAPAAYYEAVGSFYSSEDSTGGQRPGSGDIVKHARMIVSAWEAHPAKRAELNAHREALRDERDRQLKDGTFSALRGYVPPSKPKQDSSRLVQELVEGVGRDVEQ